VGDLKVHQLLHGYCGGHGQIAGSVKLSDRDSEIVTRLSDLSGSLSSGLNFENYLTVYPLPSRKFFALARTWPDPDAPRAGCVITHTLLLPVSSWANLSNVRSLDRLFRSPRLTPDHSFGDIIDLYSGSENLTADATRIAPTGTTAFVLRYFGQGLRPMVWFNTVDAEEYLWRLLEHLWPNLRSVFSCCTFALQQRALEDGPFDLLFAPPSVRSRFLKLSPDHLIEPSSLRKDTQVSSEPWCQYWADAFFSSKPGLPSSENELPIWNELGEDPTAVRKLSLIQELRERSDQAPTAGVGALDVVESLAHDPDSAIPLKRMILAQAIEAAVSARPDIDGFTCLRLIGDRLRRESFRNLADEYSERLTAAATRVTTKYPEAAFEAGSTWLADSIAGTETAFVKGVIAGLRELANTNPSRLTIVREHADIAAEIFRVEPTFASTYLQVGGETAPRALAGWLSSTKDHDTLRMVRKSVLPLLGRTDDKELLSALLRDLEVEEVGETLDVLSTISEGFSSAAARQVVSKQICSDYPSQVREWASTTRHWSHGVSELVASTYPHGRQGFNDLLQQTQFSSGKTVDVLAVMICDQASGGTPYWLQEIVTTDVRLISSLLLAGPKESDVVEAALATVVDGASDLPLAKSEDLLNAVLAFESRPVFSRLLDAAMRDIITCYLIGGFETSVTRNFLRSTNGNRWLHNVAGSTLSRVFVQGCHSGAQAVTRAWKWIAEAPSAIYQRRPNTLLELCEDLLRYSRQPFPEGAQYSFVQILSRCRSEADSDVRKKLGATMLRFSLDNIYSPLGLVVAATFADVYATATEDGNRSTSFFSVLFGSYDWDKGKDVRVSVIDAFMRSNWAPGDLAIAAESAGILRKIFKRTHRKPQGDEYINAMLRDLSQRSDPNATTVREHLSRLVSSPNFYEEWD